MRDLKVIRRVSFSWLQLVPVSALRMLIRGAIRFMIASMCGEKVKCGSSLTPRIRGFLSRGSGELFK